MKEDDGVMLPGGEDNEDETKLITEEELDDMLKQVNPSDEDLDSLIEDLIELLEEEDCD